MKLVSRYFWNILVALDQFINTLFGGDPDETVSSRLGKWHRSGRDKKRIRRLVFIVANSIVELFQKDHFNKSIEEDEGSKKVIE
jgi:hypothetical protein